MLPSSCVSSLSIKIGWTVILSITISCSSFILTNRRSKNALESLLRTHILFWLHP